MDPLMFTTLLQAILVLGNKDTRSKEETLAYGHFLAYAGTISRFNRLLVEEVIDAKLDAESGHDEQVEGTPTRVP